MLVPATTAEPSTTTKSKAIETLLGQTKLKIIFQDRMWVLEVSGVVAGGGAAADRCQHHDACVR